MFDKDMFKRLNEAIEKFKYTFDQIQKSIDNYNKINKQMKRTSESLKGAKVNTREALQIAGDLGKKYPN
ncbi:MAG: hypothetical protein ACFFAO_04355 [Candidatus Hermodarchaeota archaeon]